MSIFSRVWGELPGRRDWQVNDYTTDTFEVKTKRIEIEIDEELYKQAVKYNIDIEKAISDFLREKGVSIPQDVS